MNEVLFQILLSLRDEPRDADSVLTNIQQLDPESKPPAIASFYRGLKKGVDRGYLRILEGSDAPSKPRGRPRQKYVITRSGRAALGVEARRLGRLSRLAETR